MIALVEKRGQCIGPANDARVSRSAISYWRILARGGAPFLFVEHIRVAPEKAKQAQRRFLAHDGPHSASDKQALHVGCQRLRKLLAAN